MPKDLINTHLQGMRREELIAELQTAHSNSFVVMFLGWLCAKMPELQRKDPNDLLAAWDRFKVEMGKSA